MGICTRAAPILAVAVAAVAVAAAAGAADTAAAPVLPPAHAHPHPAATLALSGGAPHGEAHGPSTETTALSAGVGLERTSLAFHAPAANTLPWGFVEGRVANHVPGHPVIIQMYADDGSAVHFAQVDVADDGSYEYKFRVRNVDADGTAVPLFSGDYTVAVYKVVYLQGRGHA